jgi:flagellar FliL protein
VEKWTKEKATAHASSDGGFEIRNSRVEDLTDPGLALLKRKILAKSNELLGKLLLKAVLFSDFSYIEQ